MPHPHDREGLAHIPGERLRTMAASVGGEIGYPFLERLVAVLRDAMDAALVLITLGDGSPPRRARAIFALEGGMAAEQFEYELDRTPCQAVYGGRTVVIPKDLAHRFPKEEGLDGYVGMPVRGTDGVVVGHFAVFSRAPIAAPDAAESIIRIFGARVEADLRHRTLLQERDGLIEDLVQANHTLKERSQALHDANAFKTRLVGMIAHDLRNPLSVIIAKAELLQSRLSHVDFDKDRASKDVSRVLLAADRLVNLIESTLAQCREESSRIALRPRRTDVAALVRAAVETNRSEADRKRIGLAVAAGREIWSEVDEGLCLEAIDNLVSNAVKYSPIRTEGRVEVESDEEVVQVSVADQGPGLTEEDLSRAFRPFQTLSAQPTGGETATGLGLANVRQIAEAHGGSVSVSSTGEGQGATFHLVLPRTARTGKTGAWHAA